ncbi:MAG: hypothetical protein AAGF12_08150 [Myxococcota bacterium]
MTDERQTYSLDGVRADGWLQRLAEDSPNFDQLCEIIGESFVAFSVIAGVRVTALTVDRRNMDGSLVDFVVGDDIAEQRLPLGEFRRRLAMALLGDEPPPGEPPPNPSPEDLQGIIGFRYLLLAPVFGVRLLQLRTGRGLVPTLILHIEGLDDEEEVEVVDFREMIRDRIRQELNESKPASPFSIDLSAVTDAEQAMADDDYDKTIELLGAWPGPLSLLLRTTEGQQLTREVKATLARALGILGTAYVRSDRFDWADEVMRLGIQWGQDGPAAGELFERMGEACVVRERHGEAIGLLRRALALGARKLTVLPLLAECYSARERHVAAVVCVEEARALGSESAKLDAIAKASKEVLGVAWTDFRAEVPAPSTNRQTVPAPDGEGG